MFLAKKKAIDLSWTQSTEGTNHKNSAKRLKTFEITAMAHSSVGASPGRHDQVVDQENTKNEI